MSRIEYLMDHQEVRRCEGERNRHRALSFTWEQGAALVLDKYAELLGDAAASTDDPASR